MPFRNLLVDNETIRNNVFYSIIKIRIRHLAFLYSFDCILLIDLHFSAPSTVSSSSTTASTKTSSGYGGSCTPPGTLLPPEAFRDISEGPALCGAVPRYHSDPQSQRGSQKEPPADSRASQGSRAIHEGTKNNNSLEDIENSTTASKIPPSRTWLESQQQTPQQLTLPSHQTQKKEKPQQGQKVNKPISAQIFCT